MRLYLRTIEETLVAVGLAKSPQAASSLVKKGQAYIRHDNDRIRVANNKTMIVTIAGMEVCVDDECRQL